MSLETEEYRVDIRSEDDLALIVTNDERAVVPLRGRRITIGRSNENDLVLEDRFVSSKHCQVEERRGEYRVCDLGSRNGTRLNGVQVERGLISAGDSLRVGRALLLCVDRSRPSSCRPGGMVGSSRAMRRIFRLLERYACRSAPVLIEGETGTGKELAAHAVHELSARRDRPFVTVNCGALTPELAMSELFGHERGAFTGASFQHRGAFEQARAGTLFLDEVGELEGRVQAALLRTLETGKIRRVGAENERLVDVRIVAATNRDLYSEVNNDSFRLDLYHRLAVLCVQIPPLRERRGDIPELVRAMLTRAGSPRRLSPEALEMLGRHNWPGNVRELRNVVERACALTDGDIVAPRDLRFDVANEPLIDDELAALLTSVEEHGSTAAAARALGFPRTTLRDRIRRLEATVDLDRR